MNYLAHLLLSPPKPELMVGNLMGDFVKGQAFNALPELVGQGVLLHRAIDKYTDNHPQVRQLKYLLSAQRRRFAGIITDIVFDHLLAKNWQQNTQAYWPYHQQLDAQQLELAEFAQHCYRILAQYQGIMPERMQLMTSRMSQGDWLTSYQELSAVAGAINGVSRRIRFDNQLAGAITEVELHYQAYEQAFAQFFPELCEFVASYINEQL